MLVNRISSISVKSVLYQGIRMSCNFAGTLMIGRYLAVDDIGFWFYCLNLFAMLSIADYGLMQVAHRRVSRIDFSQQSEVSRVVYTSLALAGLSCVLPSVFFFVGFLVESSDEKSNLYLLAAISIGLQGFANNLISLVLASHNVERSQVYSLLLALTTVLLTSLGLCMGGGLVVIFMAQSAGALTVILAAILFILRRFPYESNFSLMKSVCDLCVGERGSIARLALMVICYQIMTRFLHTKMAHIMSPALFASYSLTVQILNASVALANSIFLLQLPKITKTYYSKGDWMSIWRVTETSALLVQFMLFGCVILLVYSSCIVMIWPKIELDEPLLLSLMVIMFIETVIGHASQVLIACGEERQLYANLIAGGGIVLLCLLWKFSDSHIALLYCRFVIYIVVCGPVVLHLSRRLISDSKSLTNTL